MGDSPATLIEYPGIIFDSYMIIHPLLLFSLTGIILIASVKYFDRFSNSERKIEHRINEYNRRFTGYKLKIKSILSKLRRNQKSTNEVITKSEIEIAAPDYTFSKIIKTSRTNRLDIIRIEFKQLDQQF